MIMKAGRDDFVCSDVGLTLFIMGAVGSLIPDISWLGGATVDSTSSPR